MDVGVPLVETQDGKVTERPTLGKIVEDLEAAFEQFRLIAGDLGDEGGV